MNELGDSGGFRLSAGNLIPDSGFEPINIRRSWRVMETGRSRGYHWITVDGGGMNSWDLTTTGYLNGASYRLYRIVTADGRPLEFAPGEYPDMAEASHFIRVGEGTVPDAGTPGLPLGGWVDQPGEQRIYLDGPEPEVWDYIFFEKRITDPDPAWSHPRLDGNGHSDAVQETWRPAWGHEESNLRIQRRPHGIEPPPQMRFPGETAYRVSAPEPGPTGVHGPYIFFPENDNPEGNFYGTLEPGRTYRYEAWMRQDGIRAGGQVELGFFSVYEDIAQSFSVGAEWQLHGFTFTAPERPRTDAWHGGPAIRFDGPGTLEIDNIRLFRMDHAEQADDLFVPSPLVLDELMAAQPEGPQKGFIRSLYVMLNNASMPSLLSTHRDADVVYDWYVSVQGADNMALPAFLDYALRTGPTPETRVKPWINISSRAPEEEWAMLMEYLAAPIDPDDPRQLRERPWAALRYRQRGVATPWTEEFPEIMVEFANETWHNGAVESQWDGWHRDGWVHQGGHEFGLWAAFITGYLRENSQWYADAIASGAITLVMGSNYDNYAEQGRPLAPDVGAIGHATYVGPRWETGEEQYSRYNDSGVQATLLGYVGGLDDELDRYRVMREELAAAGHPYRIYGYEGGPSGYSLPGTASEDAVEVAERYGKSQAMAVAALDSWLGAFQMGFSEVSMHAFAQGDYWSSHTPIRNGFRPHPSWLALSMRNRHAVGTMIQAEVSLTPTLTWLGQEEEVVGAYAFRDGSRLSVVLLNRRLDGNPVEVDLRLPAVPRGSSMRYSLDADPRDTNRDEERVQIRTEEIELRRETRVSLPPGSIQIYVVETNLDADQAPPAVPRRPVRESRGGNTRLVWQPVDGAESYVVLLGNRAHFRQDEALREITLSDTSLNLDALGDLESYVRVAAVNAWGRGMPSPAIGPVR